LLRKYLQLVKDLQGPVLLHVVTEKGHGYQPAAADPVFFHTPPAFEDENGKPKVVGSGGRPAYTNYARDAIGDVMRGNSKVTVMTAAMCQGNKLEPVRDEFPERFFDVGICESHAVAFAAGHAKTGLRPIVAIYSTFLQRSYDQIFQEVCLQNLPVVFMMDRAGLTGPDGPTHHGVFDIAYMRVFPNMVVMAPGDATEVKSMLEFALQHDGPVGIRYPKCNAPTLDKPNEPIRLGKAEVVRWGNDGSLIAFGGMLETCLQAADRMASEGLDVTVVNARFAKPLDIEVLSKCFQQGRFVVTIEEGTSIGGFGSAVLEAACEHGWDTRMLKCLALPDRFVEHGERDELLADMGLDAHGIVRACRELEQRTSAASFPR
jgi:1-deoxy-D-xylulose-5-phosphate synthase